MNNGSRYSRITLITGLSWLSKRTDPSSEWIEAEKAGLSTTSGETRLSGKFESFKFTTISGNLISDDFTSKETALNTTSGEITLSGQPGNVNSEAISGNLNFSYSDFENTIGSQNCVR